MRDFAADLERRRHARSRRGERCDLLVADQRHVGEILDCSPGGVFVQSEAPVWPGVLVRVRTDREDRYAVVLRERHIPHRLRDLMPRGFGLRWVGSRATA